MKVLWYFAFSFLVFYSEPLVRKNTWMRTTSVTVTFFFLEGAALKVTLSQKCSQVFHKIKRHTGNRIWEIIYSWRFYRNGLTYVLVLSWSNIMKRKLTKIPEKLSVAQCISRFTDAKCCYYDLTVHETFLPVNGEKLS